MAEEQKKTVKKAPAKKAPAKKAAAKKAETPVEEATPVATETPKKAPAKKAVKAEKKAMNQRNLEKLCLSHHGRKAPCTKVE